MHHVSFLVWFHLIYGWKINLTYTGLFSFSISIHRTCSMERKFHDYQTLNKVPSLISLPLNEDLSLKRYVWGTAQTCIRPFGLLCRPIYNLVKPHNKTILISATKLCLYKMTSYAGVILFLVDYFI